MVHTYVYMYVHMYIDLAVCNECREPTGHCLTGRGACIHPCRDIESIYEELVHEGVVIKCPKVRLADYVGEYR